MIALLEMLLGIHFEDTAAAQFFLDIAAQSIRNYTRLDDLDDSYNNAIVFLASYLYNNKSNLNINEKTQGERKLIFWGRAIPQEVLAMLPYPKAKWY